MLGMFNLFSLDFCTIVIQQIIKLINCEELWVVSDVLVWKDLWKS